MPRVKKQNKASVYSDTIEPIESLLGEGKIKKKEIINDNPYFPNEYIKMLIIAPSNSGKTTLIFNIIRKGFINFDTIHIFASQCEDDDYEALEKLFNNMSDEIDIPREEFPAVITPKLEHLLYPYEENGEKKTPIREQLKEDKERKHLVIIDDFSSSKYLGTSDFKDFLDTCRHYKTHVIVIFHTFKHSNVLIRERFNQLCLFNGSCDGIDDIDYLGEKLGLGLTKTMFRKVFTEATKNKYSFLYIDKHEKNLKKRYRKGFFEPLECLKDINTDKFYFER